MPAFTRSLFPRSCSLQSAASNKASRISIPSSSTAVQANFFSSSTSALASQNSSSDNATHTSLNSNSTASLDDILGSAQAQPQDATSEQDQTPIPTRSSLRSQQQQQQSLTGSIRVNRAGRTAGTTIVPHHRLHIKTSRNNTLLTFTTPDGNPLASASGGTAGFKKSQRSGYEAGYRAAFQMFDHISQYRQSTYGVGIGAPRTSAAAQFQGGLVSLAPKAGAEEDLALETIWSGFGQGREAVFRALMTNEGQSVRNLVKKVTDATPLKIGGVRPKKRRML